MQPQRSQKHSQKSFENFWDHFIKLHISNYDPPTTHFQGMASWRIGQLAASSKKTTTKMSLEASAEAQLPSKKEKMLK